MSEKKFREQRRGFASDGFARRRAHEFAAPAPRRQSPAGPPVGATVKWFSPEKGFGFVVLEDGAGDAFLHAGVVERSGCDTADLMPGATLQVRVEAGQKGPQVGEVLEIDKRTAMVGRQLKPDAGSAAVRGRATRMSGTVKWYSPEKGFGFVAAEDGQREVFVHASALQRSRVAGLAEGQRVALEVTEGRKGLEAVSVSVTG